MAETSRLQVDKLTTDKWANWKFQIQLYLQANGLWRIVTGEEARPAGEQEASAWDVREFKARAALGLTIDSSLLYLVTSKETSHDIYKALKDHFEKSKVQCVLCSKRNDKTAPARGDRNISFSRNNTSLSVRARGGQQGQLLPSATFDS